MREVKQVKPFATFNKVRVPPATAAWVCTLGRTLTCPCCLFGPLAGGLP